MSKEAQESFEKFLKDYKPELEPVQRRGFLHIGKFDFEFEFHWKYFAIIPAINLDFHGFTLEIEWLFFGFYIDKN